MRPFEVSTESSHYYYAYTGPIALTLCQTLTLSEEVDRTVMQRALTRTARTYPQCSARLATVGNRFWYVENDNPVVLYDADDHACSLGGADTNYYQYRVWAQGNQLGYAGNHGLGDGHFTLQFLTTLLFYYAVERGMLEDVALPGVTREGDMDIPAFDSYLKYANTEQTPIDTPDIGPIFAPPVAYREDRGDFRCDIDVFDVSTRQVRELAKRVGTRISPLLMALEARAVKRAWNVQDKGLIGPITNDVRTLFDSAGVGNFSSWVLGVLPAPVMQADLATQCAVLAQAMERQLAEEAVRVQLGRNVAEVAAERAIPFAEHFGEAAIERQLQNARYRRQFLGLYVSNLGGFRLPEVLAPLLVRAECVLPSYSASFNLDVVGASDNICMTIARTFEDDALSEAFVQELQDNGLDVRFERRGPRSFPRLEREAILELEQL